jgi:hypothetical protein
LCYYVAAEGGECAVEGGEEGRGAVSGFVKRGDGRAVVDRTVGSDLDSILWSTTYLFINKNGVFQKQQSFRELSTVTPNILYSMPATIDSKV